MTIRALQMILLGSMFSMAAACGAASGAEHLAGQWLNPAGDRCWASSSSSITSCPTSPWATTSRCRAGVPSAIAALHCSAPTRSLGASGSARGATPAPPCSRREKRNVVPRSRALAKRLDDALPVADGTITHDDIYADIRDAP